MTLLTVNYHSDSDVRRLVQSWRRFVGAGPVVVVANTPIVLSDAKVVGVGVNLHHGLGLDFGLRSVRTEYVVICDPDSIIAADTFWPQMRERVDGYGAASIDIGGPTYHPICMAFRTALWKHSTLSMREDWDAGYDVAGHLTDAAGGLRDAALLPRTRSAGAAIASSRPGKSHYVGEVYADAFSNTLGGSRVLEGSGAFGTEEGSVDEIRAYHQRWRAWADEFVVGRTTLDTFPTS